MHGDVEPLLAVLAARRGEFVEFVRRRARTGADAEDVLQKAFLLATRKAGALRDPDAVIPWFYRILRNALADYHGSLAATESRSITTPDTDEVVAPPYEGGTCACSVALLDSLPPRYAEILRRTDVLEEPLDDVAQSLGLTVNTVTVRLHRARKALRARLAAFCGTTSAKECLNCRCATGNPC